MMGSLAQMNVPIVLSSAGICSARITMLSDVAQPFEMAPRPAQRSGRAGMGPGGGSDRAQVRGEQADRAAVSGPARPPGRASAACRAGGGGDGVRPDAGRPFVPSTVDNHAQECWAARSAPTTSSASSRSSRSSSGRPSKPAGCRSRPSIRPVSFGGSCRSLAQVDRPLLIPRSSSRRVTS